MLTDTSQTRWERAFFIIPEAPRGKGGQRSEVGLWEAFLKLPFFPLLFGEVTSSGLWGHEGCGSVGARVWGGDLGSCPTRKCCPQGPGPEEGQSSQALALVGN